MRGRLALLIVRALLAWLLPGSAVLSQDTAPEAAAETPAPVTVTTAVSKEEVTVGETFTIELKASGPPGTSYRFATGASEDQIELRTPQPEQDAAAPEPGTHRYEAAVFALGEVEIPPIPVRYRLPDGTEGEAQSEPIDLKVGSLLPRDADQQKLADIRVPRPATTAREFVTAAGRAFWIVQLPALLVGTGLLALLFWLRRRRLRRQGSAAPSETPPDVEALAALSALEGSGLLEARAFREYYIRLTGVLKRYLERRLGAPVLEMTTAETLAFLRGHVHGGEILPAFRDLAGAADQIKFARGQGLTEAAERHLAAVRALVPALEARMAPKEPEGVDEGKAA